ncbi:MAG: DUF2760 domain-containing protein [Planctomycetaceae bacterium]
MGRLSLAWKILTNRTLAAQFDAFLKAPAALPATAVATKPTTPGITPAAPPAAVVPTPATPPPAKPRRSDALSLLASLQREGRLLDFLKEPIDSYSDSQIGAAVRDIHRDCAAVIERQFGLRPVLEQAEGSLISLSGDSAERIRTTGPKAGQAATAGTLVHAGWIATRCELPTWTGDATAALVIAPAEVEIR